MSIEFHLLFFFKQWSYLFIKLLNPNSSSYLNCLLSSLPLIPHYLQLTLSSFEFLLPISNTVCILSSTHTICSIISCPLFLILFDFCFKHHSLVFQSSYAMSLPECFRFKLSCASFECLRNLLILLSLL